MQILNQYVHFVFVYIYTSHSSYLSSLLKTTGYDIYYSLAFCCGTSYPFLSLNLDATDLSSDTGYLVQQNSFDGVL